MSLPYETATSGKRALVDIERTLREFGCSKFGTWFDYEGATLEIQFQVGKRSVCLRASASGYAAAWLRKHPYTSRMRSTLAQHQQKASQIAEMAIYSILRDWIKGQVTAIESGLMSFEAAFMPHLMLPNGQRILDVVHKKFPELVTPMLEHDS